MGARRFSFYPPILNVRHNEWIYRRATWSEFVVVNTQSGEEACIPLMFLGEVSIVDDPVIIVGLRRELEWNAGLVCAHHRPVIEMPLAVNDNRPAAAHPHRLAPVVNIRLEPPPEVRAGRKIGVAIMLGAMACLIVADVARQLQMRQLRLSRSDDYSAVIRKLGQPALDQPVYGSYRILSYPRRHFKVVLSGGHYIGTLDPQGRVLDTTTLPDGSNTASLLRSVPAF